MASKVTARSRRTLLLVVATLAFPVDAHADEGLPDPSAPLAAMVAELEQQLEQTVGEVTAETESAAAPVEEPLPQEPPDTTGSEPVAPPPQESPGAPAAASVEEPAADLTADTAQYQPPQDGPEAEEPDPSSRSDATVEPPSEWTWVWNWNCKHPPEVPAPSGTTWTWIWNWNCDGDEPLPGVTLTAESGQYHSESDRYQDGNAPSIVLGNTNTSIRIFSPGDDATITQTNSVLVAATTVTTTTIVQTVQQTVQQAVAALPTLPSVPTLPVTPNVETWPPAIEGVLGALPGQAWLGDLVDWRPRATAEATVPRTRGRRAPPETDGRAGSGAVRTVGVAATVVGATPELAPAVRAQARRKDARRDRKHEPPPVFPFPGATTGGPAPAGGSGAALLLFGFIGALVLAFLTLPPGGSYRVWLSEARMPRGVDPDQDDRPG